ncbi:MAG TPA: LuxR C-terminal-related transcriptional regulator [Euzebyales bacterium]|nr:LuxR C-terminal-related transcriptional regulator [Euzebyales bacterium]
MLYAEQGVGRGRPRSGTSRSVHARAVGTSLTAPARVPRPKIQVPRVPVNSLPRHRLVRQLSDAHGPAFVDGTAADPGVVHVCAPAGYGKSTLLASYVDELRRGGVPVAWVSCDRHDNDPAQLWSAVLQSMSAAGAGPFAWMTPPQHEMEPSFLTEFVHAVDALPAPIAVVLDDVHELVSQATLSGLNELLRNLPQQLLLCFSCRFDPPLALSRLRLEGRLHEIRARDLAFTVDEVRDVLEAQDVTLADEDTAALFERTEGWPAALRLAALSLSGEPDPAGFVLTFAGDQRSIADYLVAEVLSRQPAELRDFLIATSVAEELTVELAVELSGRVDAGAILDRLEHANALITRLGPRRRWYRYHALLRSFMLAELRSRDAAEAPRLHAIASDWFAAADMPDPALEHATAAADGARILALLRRFALGRLLSGAGKAVREVLASAPTAVTETPEVALIGGIAALEHGDLSGAERLVRSVRIPTSSDDAWLVRLYDAAQLYLARMRGDVTVLSEPPDDNLSVDPASATDASRAPGQQDVELLVLANRGTLRVAAGDYEGARADIDEALDIALRNRRDYLALHCMNQLCGIAGSLSELPTVKLETERAISFADERGWASSPRMAYAYTLAAWAAYQALELSTAARWAATAVDVIHGAMTPEVEGAARFAEALIAFDRPSERRDALQRFRRVWTGFTSVTPSPALTAYAGMAELQMCLTLGEHVQARAAIDRVERLLGPDGDAVVMRALLLLHRNRTAQARRALTPLLRDGARTTVISNGVVGWLVEAVAAARSGEPHNAHRALERALRLATPAAALRPFYDRGEPLRELLVQASGRLGDLESSATALLEAWAAASEWQEGQLSGMRVTGEGVRSTPTHNPLEPLTTREVEILRSLPSILTIEEIAAAQVVSVNTIKTHLRSIYRKLGVSSRRAAVEAGRRTGIL